jgi:3-oxoisoapionate decarboxylase
VRVGLSSYTYTWAIGVAGHQPEEPMALVQLVDRAGALGVDVLQVADNLPLHRVPAPELELFESRARELGIEIEVGARGVETGLLRQYLSLATRFGSPILRVVVADGKNDFVPSQVIEVLRPLRTLFDDAGVKLAIENHDKFTTDELVSIVEGLGTDWVGVCLDTVNSFGALEGPSVVVEKLGPFTVNLHVKDFVIRRASHMMGFSIEGRPVGQGELDVPWLVKMLGGPQKDISAIIELWTPPGTSLASTISTEREWAEMSITYLRKLLPTPARQVAGRKLELDNSGGK